VAGSALVTARVLYDVGFEIGIPHCSGSYEAGVFGTNFICPLYILYMV
jgi:hypothetical protein